MDAQEAVALALEFMDGMRITGASVEAQAAAFVSHLARDGFVVRPRIGGEGTRARRPQLGVTSLTGAEVRSTRASLGLSRAALAEMAGIRRSTLMNFESGRKVPHAATLEKLQKALEQGRRHDDQT